jgi:hypothetical protein
MQPTDLSNGHVIRSLHLYHKNYEALQLQQFNDETGRKVTRLFVTKKALMIKAIINGRES